MKKQLLLILFISLSVLIVGCEESNGELKDQKTSDHSKEENTVEESKIILVGTLDSDEEGSGVNMDQEISDSKTIVKIEDVVGNAKKIEKPQDGTKEDPDVFFIITKSVGDKRDNPGEKRFVWYQEDGGAVLTDGSGEYYTINSSQAKELKEALDK
ncbi:hypothetical protein ACJA3J_07970 [Halobacillus sp. SY10]|uniref:hypothetical protein n=1 Tax=Halobacillus sp. SY10 TaxID=3381356 RepID=UPI00387A6774